MITVSDLSGNGKGVGFVKQALVSGNLASATSGLSTRVQGLFNAALSGTFSASLILQRSLDNGITWNNVTAGGQLVTYTGPCEEIFDEPENQVLYRWNCVAYISGTIKYRISQ